MFFLPWAVMYLVCSFVQMNPFPATWHMGTRLYYSAFSIIIGLMLFLGPDDKQLERYFGKDKKEE